MDNLGLVGFTGAGANRLFDALTGLPAPSEYDAAVGVASLPDERLDLLAAMSASKKVVQAGFELVHIALPSGSKPGEGLGGKVLGSLRNCDAILVVLRAFDDGGVEADPAGDLEALELELVMTDLASVEQRLNKQRRATKSGDKEIAAEVAALERAFAALEGGTPLSKAGLSEDDRTRIAPVFCLTTKPSLVVLNTGEKVDAAAAAAIPGATAVPIDIEAEIAACAPEDPRRCGRCTAWASRRSPPSPTPRTTSSDAARSSRRARTSRARGRSRGCEGARVRGCDPQRPARGFIHAEVIDWRELLEIGSWDKARAAKKLRVEGKDYEVQDGDVLEIRFNV